MTDPVRERMMVAASSTLPDTLLRWSERFEAVLRQHLCGSEGVPAELREAMHYSLLAPGKRLRPFLVHRCHQLAGGESAEVTALCVAVECLHVFTLIHDDLPSMDDAPLRRGQPSNHRVHGEALAILAGDALLALGLELAAADTAHPTRTLSIVQELTEAIGWTGVIGGQVADIMGERRPCGLDTVREIHLRKTARLFQACCRVGALAADADESTFNNLGEYGLQLGIAFQISDDLLDVTATTTELGKQPGADAALGRQTYPRAVGIAESRRFLELAVNQAVKSLEAFDHQADDLRQIAGLMTTRTR